MGAWEASSEVVKGLCLQPGQRELAVGAGGRQPISKLFGPP